MSETRADWYKAPAWRPEPERNDLLRGEMSKAPEKRLLQSELDALRAVIRLWLRDGFEPDEARAALKGSE